MIDFHFANPGFLYALPALAVLWFVFRQLDHRVRDRLSKFLHEANLRQLLREHGTVSDRGRKAAFWLGTALLVLALARPQANPTVEEMQSSGLDIYVLLDVSRSMVCEDVAPSRHK
jgi:Ca-activated chloride channel family protein